MKTKSFLFLFLFLSTAPLLAHWENVGPGVDYQQFSRDGLVAHVSRVDLRHDRIRLVASSESEKGMRTTAWARKHDAIVAINADYFDEKHKPIGLAIGPCGTWSGTRDTRREGVIAFGDGRLEIRKQSDVMDPPPAWVEQAVSGWPLIVDSCRAFSSKALPGSDSFTRSPHPRTAVGLSEDGRWLFLVVTEGRREGVPGTTLAELAEFMDEELGACRALNLDGGGSSTMVIDGEIRNQVSDGSERWVANHLGVVVASEWEPRCHETSGN